MPTIHDLFQRMDFNRLIRLVESRQTRFCNALVEIKEVAGESQVQEVLGDHEIEIPLGNSGRAFFFFMLALSFIFVWSTLVTATSIGPLQIIFLVILCTPLISIGVYSWKNDHRVIYMNRDGVGERRDGIFFTWRSIRSVKHHWLTLQVASECSDKRIGLPLDHCNFSLFHAILNIMVSDCKTFYIGARMKDRKLLLFVL